MEREKIRDRCEDTYHRYYSLEPIGDEETKEILVISVCSNCGHVIEHRSTIKGK